LAAMAAKAGLIDLQPFTRQALQLASRLAQCPPTLCSTSGSHRILVTVLKRPLQRLQCHYRMRADAGSRMSNLTTSSIAAISSPSVPRSVCNCLQRIVLSSSSSSSQVACLSVVALHHTDNQSSAVNSSLSLPACVIARTLLCCCFSPFPSMASIDLPSVPVVCYTRQRSACRASVHHRARLPAESLSAKQFSG